MKKLKLVYTRVAVIVGVGLLAIAIGAEKGPKRTETEVFMRAKLIYSQEVLEGLSLEKFELASKAAIKLRNMTQSNLWYTSRQPDYMVQTTNYQRCTDALYMAAIDRNLDDATDAYVKVARACVDCHRLVRREQHQKLLQTKN